MARTACDKRFSFQVAKQSMSWSHSKCRLPHRKIDKEHQLAPSTPHMTCAMPRQLVLAGEAGRQAFSLGSLQTAIPETAGWPAARAQRLIPATIDNRASRPLQSLFSCKNRAGCSSLRNQRRIQNVTNQQIQGEAEAFEATRDDLQSLMTSRPSKKTHGGCGSTSTLPRPRWTRQAATAPTASPCTSHSWDEDACSSISCTSMNRRVPT